MQQNRTYIDPIAPNLVQEQAEELMNSLFSDVEHTLSISTTNDLAGLTRDATGSISNMVRYGQGKSSQESKDLSLAIATVNQNDPNNQNHPNSMLTSRVVPRFSMPRANPSVSLNPDLPKSQEPVGFIDSLLLGSAFTSAIFAMVLGLVNLKTSAPNLQPQIQAQVYEDLVAPVAEKMRRSLMETKPIENINIAKQTPEPISIVNTPQSAVKPIYIPIYQPPTPSSPVTSIGANTTLAPKTIPSPVIAAPPKRVFPKGNYTLIGVLDLGDRSSAMIDINGSIQSIKLGNAVGDSGWAVSRIDRQAVILKRGNEDTTVTVGQKF